MIGSLVLKKVLRREAPSPISTGAMLSPWADLCQENARLSSSGLTSLDPAQELAQQFNFEIVVQLPDHVAVLIQADRQATRKYDRVAIRINNKKHSAGFAFADGASISARHFWVTVLDSREASRH